MKHSILHKCGHISTVELYGNEQSQKQRIAQLEHQDCNICWIDKQPPQFTLQRSLNGPSLARRGYRLWRGEWLKAFATNAELDAELSWLAEHSITIDVRKRREANR